MKNARNLRAAVLWLLRNTKIPSHPDPHHFTQPKTNPQHLESRDNREDARHADHHANVVQCSGKPSCQQSCPTYQQNPYAAYNLNPADQFLKHRADRQPDRRSVRRVCGNIQYAEGTQYFDNRGQLGREGVNHVRSWRVSCASR